MGARRFRRRPPVMYFVVAAIALLLISRAGWQALDVEQSDVASNEFEAGADDALLPGRCEMVRVVDGDTIVVRQSRTGESAGSPGYNSEQNSTQFRVRLLGIDTPETVKEGTPVQDWGPESTAFTREFLRGRPISVELDKRRVDRFGRSLAYVYAGDEMLNVELVRAGLARVSHYPGDSLAILKLLRQAEAEARGAGRGIWSDAATLETAQP